MLDEMSVEIQPKDTLRYIISTDIGHGPKVIAGDNVNDPQHLLDVEGCPKC